MSKRNLQRRLSVMLVAAATGGNRPFSDIQLPELLAAKQSLARAARGHRRLLNHLIGALQKSLWDREPERCRSLEVRTAAQPHDGQRRLTHLNYIYDASVSAGGHQSGRSQTTALGRQRE